MFKCSRATFTKYYFKIICILLANVQWLDITQPELADFHLKKKTICQLIYANYGRGRPEASNSANITHTIIRYFIIK